MQKNLIIYIIVYVTPLFTIAQHTAVDTDVDVHYRTGLELMEKSNYAAARQSFERYAALSEDSFKKASAEYYAAFNALSLYHGDGEMKINTFIRKYPDHPKALQAYYELGRFYYKDKKYRKAITYFSKVSVKDLNKEQQKEVDFKLGYSYFTKKDFEPAKERFDKLKVGKSEYAAASAYYAGYIAFQDNDYEQALVDFRRAENTTAYRPIVPYMIANVYFRQGNYDELIRYAEPLVKRDNDIKDKADIQLLLGEAYFKKGDYAQAGIYYKSYVEGQGTRPSTDVLYRMGYAHYLGGQTKEAIANFKKVASKSDTLGVYAAYYLGVVYLKEDNKNYALTAFDDVSKNTFDEGLKEEGAYQYAKLVYAVGRDYEAIGAFHKFLEEYPNSSHTREINDLLSQAYLKSNDYDKAIQHIESMPSKSRKVEAAYQKATYLKGSELFNKTEYTEALSYFDKSLRYPQEDNYVVLASYWSAEIHSIKKEYGPAQDLYLKVLGNPAAAEGNYRSKARYGLGYAHFNEKAYDKALIHFKAYVDNTENKDDKSYYDDALIRLADCYYVAKRYKEAILFYNKSLEFSKIDNDYAYLQIGVVKGIQGDMKGARANLAKVEKNYAKSRYLDDALFQKAQLNFEKGNYKTAAQEFSVLIEKKPKSKFVPTAYLRRGAAYYNLQQYDRTIKDYATVLERFPTDPRAKEALIPLQEALTAQGRGGEFDTYLANFKKSNPDDKGLENLEFESAKTVYFAQNYKKAIAEFEKFLNSYPESAKAFEARYYMGESNYRLERYKEALPHYREVLQANTALFVNRATYRIAEINFKQGNFREAVNYYGQMSALATNKKEEYNAWSGLMLSYHELEVYDSVSYYAMEILDKAAVNASAQNRANLYLGKAAFSKGDFDTAKDEFINTLNTAKDVYGAEAQYLLAKIFYENEAYQQSIDALIELNNSFHVYEEWLGQGFLLIVDNYIAMEEYYQAKGTLNSIVEDFPLEHIREEARQKLKVLEKLESKIESDTLNNN